MRRAATSSAFSVSAGHCASASAISFAVTRSVSAVSDTLSNFAVSSTSAASPRARTSAMIARTACATSSSVSRLAEISAAKSRAKPGARASRRRAISTIVQWMLRAGLRGPRSRKIGQPCIEAFHFQLHRAAAGKQKLHNAPTIFIAIGRELDREQRNDGVRVVAFQVVRLDAQHIVEMQPRPHAQIPPGETLRIFPFEAVEHAREPPGLGQVDEILHARDRILQLRGDDFD